MIKSRVISQGSSAIIWWNAEVLDLSAFISTIMGTAETILRVRVQLMCANHPPLHFCHSLWTSVFGDSFSPLGHCMLCQFSGQKKTNSCLHLSARDGWAFVVLGQSGRLCGNSLENIIDEGIHDAHCSAWDASVRMDLHNTAAIYEEKSGHFCSSQ